MFDKKNKKINPPFFCMKDFIVVYLTANEREVIAVLKLISHTATNFPGVFYHGKPTAILPVIGRVLPFFAEPAFRLVIR